MLFDLFHQSSLSFADAFVILTLISISIDTNGVGKETGTCPLCQNRDEPLA